MLSNKNIIAFSYCTNKKYIETAPEEFLLNENDELIKTSQKERMAYKMCIQDFCHDYCYSTIVDFGCKKISLFNANTYIFITLEGMLGTCWLESDNENGIRLKWNLKIGLKNKYIDFAPDMARVDDSGFTWHWAFLTDKGEIFRWDFEILQPKYTLYFANRLHNLIRMKILIKYITMIISVGSYMQTRLLVKGFLRLNLFFIPNKKRSVSVITYTSFFIYNVLLIVIISNDFYFNFSRPCLNNIKLST